MGVNKFLFLFLLLSNVYVFGQDAQLFSVNSRENHNISDFTPVQTFKNVEVLEANKDEINHSELGKLFPNAPCDSCYEVLSERTIYSKRFIVSGTNGSDLFIQQSIEPLHFLGDNGELQTINPNLVPAGNGRYEALQQVNQIRVDAQEGFVDFGTKDKKIKFNNNLTLWGVSENGGENLLSVAKWDNYTAGDEGIEVKNIFPGIDLLVVVTIGKMKTSFLISQKQDYLLDYEKIIIKDEAQLIGENLSFKNEMTQNRTVSVVDENGESIYYFGEGTIIYNNSIGESDLPQERESLFSTAKYHFSENSLDFVVEKNQLDVPESAYPIMFDPLLQANATTNVYGSGYDASCSAPYSGCIYNMTITVPAAVQLTDLILNSFSYYAWSPCWMSDGAARIALGSCEASLQCNSFYGGECIATANQSITSFYQNCFPAPSCSSYPLNFTLNLYRCYSSSGGCSTYCIEGWKPWTMTIQGRTLETQSVVTGGNSTICAGSSAQIFATGHYGVTPYSVTWNPGGINGSPATVSPNSTTTYTATITDACGNTTTGSTTVTVIPSPVASASSNSPVCPGQSINLTGSGGGTYSWTGPNGFTSSQQNPTIPNVTQANQGTYTLTVTSGGCTNQTTVSVVVGTSNPVSASSNAPICEGLALNLTASGGISYSWTGPNGFTSNQQNPTIPNATPSHSGTYSVTIATGDCPSIVDVPVTIHAAPSVPTINTAAPTCSANGAATISNYNSSDNYNFTPAGPTVGSGGAVSGLTPGTSYSVTATNSNNCVSAAATFTVQPQFSTPNAPTINTTPPTCSNDGSATVGNYDGTYTYTFSPSGPTVGSGGAISGATPGTSYTITATNTDGCTSSSSTFTNSPQLAAPSAPNVSTINPTCSASGVSTITDYDNSYTYTFTPSGPTVGVGGAISGATPGTSYTVTATNTDGCVSGTSSFANLPQLPIPPNPDINTVSPTCLLDGSSTVINYDPNYTYTFTPSGPSVGSGGVITGATLGTSYTVTATNNDGCPSGSVSFTNQPQLAFPTLTINVTDAAACGADGTLEFVFSGVPDGSYVVDYDGGSFNVTLVGGQGTVSAPPGNYTNIVIAISGCNNVPADVVVSEPVTPDSPIISTVPANCSMSGESAITNFNSSYTYTFTPSGPTVDPATGLIQNTNYGQNYSVTASENSCVSDAANFMNEAQHPTPVISISANNTSVCLGDAVVLTASSSDNNTTFVWSDGLGIGATQTVTPNISTTYTVTGTNSYGCEAEAQISISVHPIEQPIFTGDPLVGCASHLVNFTSNVDGSSGVNCQWSFGDGGTSNACGNVSHLYNSSGEYDVTLTVSNSTGCSKTYSQTSYVEVFPKPIAHFTANPTKVDLSDTEVDFTNASKGATNYTWNFGDGTEEQHGIDVTHSFPNATVGQYTVTLLASNDAGCEDSYQLIIEAEEDLIFYIPNAFTPDNDNYNEIFLPIFTSGFDHEGYSLLIFNRWGETLFESHDATIGWDGTYGGKIVQDGVYIWKIEVKLKYKEERRTFSGHFSLIR